MYLLILFIARAIPCLKHHQIQEANNSLFIVNTRYHFFLNNIARRLSCKKFEICYKRSLHSCKIDHIELVKYIKNIFDFTQSYYLFSKFLWIPMSNVYFYSYIFFILNAYFNSLLHSTMSIGSLPKWTCHQHRVQ